jgi:hypothetical protein
MAINCTMPLEFFASAEAGDTVMLCSWRADIVIMELPPQDAAVSRTDVIVSKSDALRMNSLWMDALRISDLQTDDLRINDLRIDTSKSTCREGHEDSAIQWYAHPRKKGMLG